MGGLKITKKTLVAKEKLKPYLATAKNVNFGPWPKSQNLFSSKYGQPIYQSKAKAVLITILNRIWLYNFEEKKIFHKIRHKNAFLGNLRKIN